MLQDSHYIHAYFSGRVQGVGFRYTTLQLARGYEVAGHVRNLSDGRVELEAEGAAGELHAFLAQVQRQLGDYIRNTELSEAERAPQFRDFTIR